MENFQKDIDKKNNIVLEDNLKEENNYKETKKRKWNKLPFIFSLVFFLLLIGVGVFSYYFYNNYYLTPERVVTKMFNNLSNVNSFEYNGEIKTKAYYNEDLNNDLFSIDNSSVAVELFFNGLFYEEKDRSNLKNELNMTSKISFVMSGLNLSFDIDLDIKNNKEEFYIKLNNFPPIPFLALDNLKNKWIKFDIEKDFDQIDVKEEYEKQREFFDTIQEELLKGKILEITEVFANKTIDKTDVYHYSFDLNKEELDRVLEIALESEDNYLEEEAKKMKESFEFFNIKNGEIFIGKKDFLPYKISFNPYVESEEMSFESTNIVFNFNNFNKEFDINFPEDSYSIEDITTEMFQGLSF